MPEGCAYASFAWLLGSSRPLLVVDGDREVVESLLQHSVPATHVLARWAFEGGLATRDASVRLPPLVDPVDAFRLVRGLTRPAVLSVGRLRTLWSDLAARRPFVDLLREGISTGTTLVAIGLPEEIPADLGEWSTTARMVPLTAVSRAHLDAAFEPWLEPDGDARAGPLLRQVRAAASEMEYLALATHGAGQSLLSQARRLVDRRSAAGVECRVWPPAANRCEVGGLGRLKAWASTLRAGLAADARVLNLQPELAVLLTGTPESGPAAVGAMVARELQWPLVQLAATREGRGDLDCAAACAHWLAAVEGRLPAVVLLDDLESLGLVGPEGEPTTTLDRVAEWVRRQDRRALLVGIVRDPWLASDALVSTGRFTRIFFLDLPDAAERDAILRVHLRANRQPLDSLALGPLVDRTDGFTQGELARLVAVAVGRLPLTEGTIGDALLEEASRSLPWSLTRRSEALRLRQMARGRFEPAK